MYSMNTKNSMKFQRQTVKVNIIFIFASILTLLINDTVSGEDGLLAVNNTTDLSAWSITVLADFHGAESFANNPNPSTNINYQDHLKTLSYIRNTYDGGDVVLLPGDSNNGRWWDPKYINRFFKGQSPKDVVYQASINCYRTLKQLLEEAGYSIALMAIGDHELGDNGWVVGYPKTPLIEDYRQGFRHGFNSDGENKFLYKDDIVADDLVALSTPWSTEHKKLSFAYQHKNVLFITIDIYEQMSTSTNYINKSKGRGGEGVITGTMRNEHLQWFENVLRVGRESSSIKHIIVQAHIPVKEPVRKIRSSAMSVDDGVKSDFWKLMVEYDVDLYLAGEVHATTCTKDEKSNLVQIASRANSLNGFLKIVVEDNKLMVIRYSEDGPLPKHNRNYEQSGILSIDKSGKVVEIHSSGALELVDLSKALIRFSFEDIYPLKTRPIEGLLQLNNTMKIGLVAKSTLIRGIKSTQSLPNLGTFGQPYDAQVAKLKLFSKGAISGKKSAYFNGSTSRHSIYSFGPLSAVTTISYSLWVRTAQKKEMILVHYGAAWSNKWFDSIKSAFTLTMANGMPKLYARENAFLTTAKDEVKLNDLQWHHIAISIPKSNCKLSEVELYIDGRKQKTRVQNDETLFFLSYGRVSLGGLGYSASTYEERNPHWKQFQGGMDEFVLWSRSINNGDLAWSMNKNFEKIFRSSCGETNKKIVLDKNATKAACAKICKKRPTCFGFEGTLMDDGFNQCTLYKVRPSKGQRRKQTQCAIAK